MDDDVDWQLRRPELLIERLVGAGLLAARGALLCRVRHAASTQELVATARLWARAPSGFEGRSGAGSRAYAALGISARSWYAEPWGTEITVPVVVRAGPAVGVWPDYAVLDAVRYGLGGLSITYDGPLLVTPHGWVSLLDRLGAARPRASGRLSP